MNGEWMKEGGRKEGEGGGKVVLKKKGGLKRWM